MKTGKTVVIIDAGGRGAALVHAYSKSPLVSHIIAIPGNDLMGINTKKPLKTYPHLKTTSVNEIIEICKKEKADLVDVAHDNAVEAGLVDRLTEQGFDVFGPTKAAGQLEWDKAWSRLFMEKYDIPVPLYRVCYSQKDGIEYIKKQKSGKWFVKASGLAEGKGALPAENKDEAIDKIKQMSQFGKAGETFVIEDWLEGEEFSTFAVCDGNSYKMLGYAQDHKRVFNNDLGENTGGMGCNTPPLVVTNPIKKQTEDVIQKTLNGMIEEGRPYKGILYIGGIVVKNELYIIEFNARWGDPEVEIIAPSIKSDLYLLAQAVITKSLSRFKITLDSKSRIVVAGCSKGYPTDYSAVKGKEVLGIDHLLKVKGITVYGAGIKKVGKKYVAQGGRLLYVIAEGKDVLEARKNAYGALSQIHVEGNNLHFRTDIGYRDVERIMVL